MLEVAVAVGESCRLSARPGRWDASDIPAMSNSPKDLKSIIITVSEPARMCSWQQGQKGLRGNSLECHRTNGEETDAH